MFHWARTPVAEMLVKPGFLLVCQKRLKFRRHRVYFGAHFGSRLTHQILHPQVCLLYDGHDFPTLFFIFGLNGFDQVLGKSMRSHHRSDSSVPLIRECPRYERAQYNPEKQGSNNNESGFDLKIHRASVKLRFAMDMLTVTGGSPKAASRGDR